MQLIELKTLKASDNKECILSLSFSPNGKFLASVEGNSKIRLWDALNWTDSGLVIEPGEVNVVAFSPDSETFATGGSNQTFNSDADDYSGIVKIWDVSTLSEQSFFDNYRDAVISLSYSLDGRLLASGDADGAIKILDVVNGKELLTLTGDVDGNTTVVFSPDNKTLISAGGDEEVKFWDVTSGELIKSWLGHYAVITNLACSPAYNYVVSVDREANVIIWDIATGETLDVSPEETIKGIQLAFSPDGKTLATGEAWGLTTIRLFDVKAGQELCSLLFEDGICFAPPLAFSPNGKVLAAGFQDGSIKLWELQ